MINSACEWEHQIFSYEDQRNLFKVLGDLIISKKKNPISNCSKESVWEASRINFLRHSRFYRSFTQT